MSKNEKREIRGLSKSIRALLAHQKYAIDYYQREYRWEKKQVDALVNDLVNVFQEHYSEEDARNTVANYGNYFLGSIIISSRNGLNYIIDGQQRLTTLTLLLIFLNNLQKKKGNIDVKIDELVYSEKYGEKSFNLNIEMRTSCMNALFENGIYDNGDTQESIRNIVEAYRHIDEGFPEELKKEALPFFIDWLIDNVILVEITALADQDAYRIFETMNDRGLSLTLTEMLKGYLLSNIDDEEKKNQCNKLWKDRIQELIKMDKDEDTDFIKAWLRSQYAKSIREHKKNADPEDYDKIGTEFHRWVRDNEDNIGLKQSEDFNKFIKINFDFYSKIYIKLYEASHNFSAEYKHVYYISQIGFTLHYQLLLAPLTIADNPETIQKKIRIIAIYLDIMLHRRLWNCYSIDYSTMAHKIFRLIIDVRSKTVKEVATLLKRKLEEEDETFRSSRLPYRQNLKNKKQIKSILARLTDYVEEQSDKSSHYQEYIDSKSKDRYEIEHIWPATMKWQQEGFESQEEFENHRNLIGGLLLLPRSFNASFGDMRFEEKVGYYISHNIMARSLHEKAYNHNPRFKRFIKESGLDFKPYAVLKKEYMLERQKLYEEIAERIWNPDLIDIEM